MNIRYCLLIAFLACLPSILFGQDAFVSEQPVGGSAEPATQEAGGLLGVAQGPAVELGQGQDPSAEAGQAVVGPDGQRVIRSLSDLPPEQLERIPVELRGQIESLLGQSAEFRQRFDAYLDVQASIAETNYATIEGLGSDLAGPLAFNPTDTFDRLRMQSITREWLAGVNDDLATGRTGQFIDTRDPSLMDFTQISSTFELNRLLQENDIPQDFGSHSPANLAELRSLQMLEQGHMPQAGDSAGHGALSRYFQHMSDDKADTALLGMVRSGIVPEGLGIERSLPNATDLPGRMDALQADQERVNHQLSELGLGPIGAGDLVDSLDRRQQFVETVNRHGVNLYERYGGERDDPFLTTRLENSRLGISEIQPLTGAQQDELVRINDSRQLLHGNQSGLSLTDIPMSSVLRDRLGLPEQSPSTTGHSFDTNYQFQMPDIFRQRDQTPLMEQIDRAALVPVEGRSDYLSRIRSNVFSDSLDEQNQTLLLAHSDDTVLNRAAELADPFSYVFQQNKTDWIGPRAELRTFQANRIAGIVDEKTTDATENIIYGRHGAAMDDLRQTVSPLDFHRDFNDVYQQQHEATELRTGMTVATLPLALAGGAGTAIRGGRRLFGGGASIARGSSILRGSANVADDLARGAANVGDDLLRGAANGGDDLVRGAANGGDDALRGIGQLSRRASQYGDDVLRTGRQVTVRRSSGAIQSDWRIRNVNANGNVVVERPSEGVIKQVRASELARRNPPVRPAQIPTQARGQALSFNQQHRINPGQPIRDGFADGGRGMQVSQGGTATSGREVVVVDRARDVNLQRHLEYARSVRNLPEAERARALSRYVDNVMTPQGGRHNSLAASRQLEGRFAGNEVLIGDVPEVAGGGVCRHRSLLYKLMGDEAGLETALVRGNMASSRGIGGHAWNEVRLANGRTLVVDVMNPLPEHRLPSVGEVGSRYLTVQNQPIYTAN